MKTFEEWWPKVEANGGRREHKELCKITWDVAREGMVPIDGHETRDYRNCADGPMMNLEEWKKIVDTYSLSKESQFDLARRGTIPADQAIKVPPVEEWPEWAKGIMVYFCQEPEEEFLGKGNVIDYIHKQASAVPKWTPKVGDVVFAGYPKTEIGKIVKGPMLYRGLGTGNAYTVKLMNGTEHDWDARDIKLFSPEKIGLPWEEI